MAISGAEDTVTKISSLVESQFPEFMREDGPRFVDFLKAYYEFMEQASTANGPMPIHAARSLPNYTDIDRTLESFVEEFRKEFMTSIPKNIQSDKKLLSKYIRDFYRSRGSQYSYETLFRALFDDEVLFYYPGEDILRASDGRWIKTTTAIVGPPFTGNIDEFGGREITSSSGGTATVLEVYRIQLKGVVQYVLTLDNVKGDFVDGDFVTDTEGTSAEVLSSAGSLIQIDILDGGAFHNVGDILNITGTTSGAASIGVVRATSTGTAVTARIVDGGSGYEVGANNIVTVSGSPGTGLDLSVTAIANTSTANLAVQTILPVATVPLNQGPNFQAGPNTATLTSQFATANVANTLIQALKFENITFGAISKIRINDVGSGYTTLPGLDIKNQRVFDLGEPSKSYSGARRGHDAILVSNVAPGTASVIQITSGGSAFQKGEIVTFTNQKTQVDNDTSTLDRDSKTVTTTTASHYDGSGEAVVSGVIQNPGSYFDTKGFLSWDKKLQDNYYYQEYSYVLRATTRLKQYRNIVEKILHPAGTKMFGQVDIVITANLQPTAIFTLPSVFPVDEEESVSASDEFVQGTVFATISQSEAVSAGDAVDAVNVAVGELIENASASDATDATIFASGILNETTSATDSKVVTVDFAPAINESVSASESQVQQTDFAPAVSESVSASESQVQQTDFVPAINESVSASEQQIAEHFIQDEYYVQVQYANNVILEYQSQQIQQYQSVPIEALDGNPRLVTAVSPDAGLTASFAGGTLKANTGSIQVGGPGTNLIFVPVSTGTPSAIFAVNTIFSNTAFTLRTDFLPVTANARFSYSTAS